MATITPLKSPSNIVDDLFEEWNDHKRKMTFQRYISERMPMFFGPLASNVPLFEKIKTAERQLDIRFTMSKQNNFWTGNLHFFDENFKCPNFALEDDLRLFLILLHLKLKVTKKPA
jgi:hypothetical protein